MKQFWVAAKNNIKLQAYNRHGFCDITPEELDIWYCQDWRLVFADHTECYNWLSERPFLELKHNRHDLLKGLDRLYKVLGSENDLLNANLAAKPVLDLIKHFSQHYFRSSRINYNPMTAAWEHGNKSILRECVRKCFCS